ncbi:unnamed protein product [Dovyalis caffra]|uniref:Uncharacterized protein n=1 Tax=Dovyalis caffra TaxID=77055 RepID=A0AAV1R4Q7_9ROSI|nr:unnamed protein product [Dovyalis caffra]
MQLRGPLVGPDRWWYHTLLKGTVRDTLASYGSVPESGPPLSFDQGPRGDLDREVAKGRHRLRFFSMRERAISMQSTNVSTDVRKRAAPFQFQSKQPLLEGTQGSQSRSKVGLSRKTLGQVPNSTPKRQSILVYHYSRNTTERQPERKTDFISKHDLNKQEMEGKKSKRGP